MLLMALFCLRSAMAPAAAPVNGPGSGKMGPAPAALQHGAGNGSEFSVISQFTDESDGTGGPAGAIRAKEQT